MAYSSIVKPTDYFNTVTYSGNGSSTQAITGVGHQPDWVWIKSRSNTENHMLSDVVRGSTKRLRSDTTNAEDDLGSNGIQSFDTDGFTAGDGDAMNASGQTYVAWNWKAGGSASSNGNGSITSSVSANTTAGFSIVSFTGTGSNATVGHGLGAAPAWVTVKKRVGTGDATLRDWNVYHGSLGNTKRMILNLNHAVSTSSEYWNDTSPTSSVVTLGTNDQVNGNNNTYIMYAFAEIKGYSKFGSYKGNGNADGPFVHTGFKPAFVMTKRSNNTENWYILDNERSPFNPPLNALAPNLSNAEDTSATGRIQDFLSNGFKLRTSDTAVNGSGDTYIFMAFAENPFVGNDSGTAVPVTAR